MKAISKTQFIEAVRTWDAKQVADTLRERPEFDRAASIATASALLKAGVPIDAVAPIKDDGEVCPAHCIVVRTRMGS
jgi:hypothetical protein